MALTTINRPDNEKSIFGTGDDLKIYHDGSDSIIHQDGTGDLRIPLKPNVNTGGVGGSSTGVNP